MTPPSGASAAVAVPASSPASSALLFKSDAADVGFPWAGAGLLVLLVALAVAARWQALRGGSAPGWLRRWLGSGKTGAPVAAGAALGLQSTVRLDAQTQLHVVQWEGRRLLVATSVNASPVLLDRAVASDAEMEAR